MAVVYVAMSKNLTAWASDVGLGKHIYKLGVTDGSAEDAIKALSDEICAGESDWRLVTNLDAAELDEAGAVARLARKEKLVDPNYYPRLRGAIGIFRVKIANVANHILIKRALAGEQTKADTPKATDIAAYLIQGAQE